MMTLFTCAALLATSSLASAADLSTCNGKYILSTENIQAQKVEMALTSSVQSGALRVVKRLDGQIRTVYSFELGFPNAEGEALVALESTRKIPGVILECNRDLSF